MPAAQPAYDGGVERVHRHHDVGVQPRLVDDLRARRDVLLVGVQRPEPGTGLDGDVVPQPGQLADQLGHQRDPGLPRHGSPGPLRSSPCGNLGHRLRGGHHLGHRSHPCRRRPASGRVLYGTAGEGHPGHMDVRFVDARGRHPHDSDDVVGCSSATTGSSGSTCRSGTSRSTASSPGWACHPLVIEACRQRNHVPDRARLRRPLLRHRAQPAARRGRARAPARARPDHRRPVPGHRARPAQPGRRPGRGARRDRRRCWPRIEAGRFHPTTPAELSYAVTSAVARRQRGLVGDVAEKLPGLEQHVMASQLTDPEALLERMFLIRHELITARTMAAQTPRRLRPDRLAGPVRAGRRPARSPATSPTSSTGSARSPTGRRSSCSA